MLHVYTGRNRLMAPALCAAVRALGEAPQIIVVPRQLTLQTERMLLDALQLKGSFQLQVLTAERLCARIFAETGLPEGARVDDRGRVMLVRAALQAARAQLTVYRGQEHRRGFPERAAKQLECIRQAGIAPETLRACADAQTGVTAMKLNDLSHILEAYEMLLEGRYQDGESEFNAASARAGEAPFLRDRAVWFFGFDMMPPTLHHLIAAVAAACSRTGLFLPLENDSSARDFDAFLPMQRAFTRIVGAAKLAGTAVRRVEVAEGDGPFRFPDAEANLFGLIPGRDRVEVRAPDRRAELRLLEQELFAFPPKPSNMPARSVQLILTANPGEECHFAAALTRRLVMERNWRWNDVMLLCQDVENYAQPLKTAFAAYGIPLFLSSSRSAARHATAECLLTALLCVQKGFLPEDMLALARTGLMPVTDDEADRLANYAVRYGLRGSRFLHPLRRGSEAEIDALEPVRARLTEPLIRLRELLRRARTLDDQLAALYAFLTDVDAFGKSQRRMALLAEAGLREAAGEEGQVWNRIIGTLDQMHSLMGPQRLPLREIHETLLESLSAAVIKPLPQSGDAVYAQNADSALTRPYRAVLLLGASDRTVSEGDGLLTQAQTQTLSGFADAYLGPGDADLSRLRRFYLKSALGMASDYVAVSCPLSGSDGSAQRPSAMFGMISRLFPGMNVRGGMASEAPMERLLRCAPRAAVTLAARALASGAEGIPLPDWDQAALAGLSRLARQNPDVKTELNRLSAALNRTQTADAMSPQTARALYGVIQRQSVTRLERFAACPFSYYARYGLQPDPVEPFVLNARDEGGFFHAAVNEFLLRSRDDLNLLSAEVAAERMDGIADGLIEAMRDTGPLGDSAVSLAERRRLKDTARTCAAALANHMRDSLFRNDALEQSFGAEDGDRALTLSDGCVLEGRIDRIDAWSHYLRVIDYKRGGKALKLDEAYYGLRLQLPVYLAAAMRRRNMESAGVYYFPLDDGILTTQSTDPGAVHQQRTAAFRMEGLVPDDMALLKAMAPNYTQVLRVRGNEHGLYKGVTAAGRADFEGLTRCALHRAEGHLSAIRQGACAAAPARLAASGPCAWCDFRAACLFDERLDAGRIRKLKPLPQAEALMRIRAEFDPEAGEAPEHQ